LANEKYEDATDGLVYVMCGCGHWQHYGIECKRAILVWGEYQEQLAERTGSAMDTDEYLEVRTRFAVGSQPRFLAEILIEAANDLKTNRTYKATM